MIQKKKKNNHEESVEHFKSKPCYTDHRHNQFFFSNLLKIFSLQIDHLTNCFQFMFNLKQKNASSILIKLKTHPCKVIFKLQNINCLPCQSNLCTFLSHCLKKTVLTSSKQIQDNIKPLTCLAMMLLPCIFFKFKQTILLITRNII